jgi:hypothetical protein
MKTANNKLLCNSYYYLLWWNANFDVTWSFGLKLMKVQNEMTHFGSNIVQSATSWASFFTSCSRMQSLKKRKGSGSMHETVRFWLEVLHGEVRTCRVPTDSSFANWYGRMSLGDWFGYMKQWIWKWSRLVALNSSVLVSGENPPPRRMHRPPVRHPERAALPMWDSESGAVQVARDRC